MNSVNFSCCTMVLIKYAITKCERMKIDANWNWNKQTFKNNFRTFQC